MPSYLLDNIIQESEVAVEAEVEVGADSPLVDGWSGGVNPLAYVIYTTCRW